MEHQAAKLLRRKEMVPKKGLEPQSFDKLFCLNRIATSTEYNRLADFATQSTNSTASSGSIQFDVFWPPSMLNSASEWTPFPTFAGMGTNVETSTGLTRSSRAKTSINIQDSSSGSAYDQL
jgi:hypothetical protein